MWKGFFSCGVKTMVQSKNNSETKPVIVTSNLIKKNGKYLLVQEGEGPAKGLWNFPAGRLEKNIPLSWNAEKEVKEETGYQARVKSLVGVYQDVSPKYCRVIIVFNSSIAGGSLRKHATEEILQAKWLALAEIKKIKKQLRSEYVLDAIADYEKE